MQSTYFITQKKIQLSSFHWEPNFTEAMDDFKPKFKSTVEQIKSITLRIQNNAFKSIYPNIQARFQTNNVVHIIPTTIKQ